MLFSDTYQAQQFPPHCIRHSVIHSIDVVVVNTDLNSEDIRLEPSTLVEYILEATTMHTKHYHDRKDMSRNCKVTKKNRKSHAQTALSL